MHGGAGHAKSAQEVAENTEVREESRPRHARKRPLQNPTEARTVWVVESRPDRLSSIGDVCYWSAVLPARCVPGRPSRSSNPTASRNDSVLSDRSNRRIHGLASDASARACSAPTSSP